MDARSLTFKLALALIPLLLTALVTLAWQNSHRLELLAHDLERLEARGCP
jgi:hypothetical protein